MDAVVMNAAKLSYDCKLFLKLSKVFCDKVKFEIEWTKKTTLSPQNKSNYLSQWHKLAEPKADDQKNCEKPVKAHTQSWLSQK